MNHSLIEKMEEENNKTKEMARMPQPNKLPHLVIVKSDKKDYLNFLFDHENCFCYPRSIPFSALPIKCNSLGHSTSDGL